MAKLHTTTRLKIVLVDDRNDKDVKSATHNLILPSNIEKDFFNVGNTIDEELEKVIKRHKFLGKKIDADIADADEFDEFEELDKKVQEAEAIEIPDKKYIEWINKNVKGDTSKYLSQGEEYGHKAAALFGMIAKAYVEAVKKGN